MLLPPWLLLFRWAFGGRTHDSAGPSSLGVLPQSIDAGYAGSRGYSANRSVAFGGGGVGYTPASWAGSPTRSRSQS
jgi:hypothetical protein